ncbi:hypothetical protein Q5P01_008468 [Channa striata]|uniref:Uncharacterized protein n=1 Tax=Channa striata TaxID=64152 RepID=A0AA88N562_CHASR|nr:hypothetical protein Q5P01_008468 [Channa striata]
MGPRALPHRVCDEWENDDGCLGLRARGVARALGQRARVWTPSALDIPTRLPLCLARKVPRRKRTSCVRPTNDTVALHLTKGRRETPSVLGRPEMDRAHAVPGQVAGESERLGLGGAQGSRSSAAMGLEPRGLSMVELYDSVCEARVLGEADAQRRTVEKAILHSEETRGDRRSCGGDKADENEGTTVRPYTYIQKDDNCTPR